MSDPIPPWDPKAFDQQDVNNFVKQLEEEAMKNVVKQKHAKKDAEFDAQMKQISDAGEALKKFIELMTDKKYQTKPLDERQKELEQILVMLFGALLGEKHQGQALPGEIKTLIDLYFHNPTDEDKKKKLIAAIQKLVVTALSTAGGGTLAKYLKATAGSTHKDVKELKGDKLKQGAAKDLNVLAEKVSTLVQLAAGTLTEAEKETLLQDNLMALITSAVVVEQIEWFVTENFLTYLQAVKIGYSLGKPFGDMIAKDLGGIVKARYGEDFLIALEQKDPGWLNSITPEGKQSVKVKIESGSFIKWEGVAFWDFTVNEVRIQVVTPKGRVILLDPAGHDVTGEALQFTATATPTPSAAQLPEGGNKAAYAIKYALEHDKAVIDASKVADAKKSTADAANQAWTDASLKLADLNTAKVKIEGQLQQGINVGGKKAKLEEELAKIVKEMEEWGSGKAKAQMEFSHAHHEWWKAHETFNEEVKKVLRKAVLEGWGDGEFQYLKQYFPQWAITREEVPGASVPAGALGKAPKWIRVFNPKVVYVAVALIAAGSIFAFLLLRDSDKTQSLSAADSVARQQERDLPANAAPAVAAPAVKALPSVCAVLKSDAVGAIVKQSMVSQPAQTGNGCLYNNPNEANIDLSTPYDPYVKQVTVFYNAPSAGLTAQAIEQLFDQTKSQTPNAADYPAGPGVKAYTSGGSGITVLDDGVMIIVGTSATLRPESIPEVQGWSLAIARQLRSALDV